LKPAPSPIDTQREVVVPKLTLLLSLLLFGHFTSAQESKDRARDDAQTKTAAAKTAGRQGRAEGLAGQINHPTRLIPESLSKPPEISREQREALERSIGKERSNRPKSIRSSKPLHYSLPRADSFTEPSNKSIIQLNPLAPESIDPPPSDLVSFLGIAVAAPGSNGGTPVNEPAVAQAGKNIVYSGNWYLARSSDGGLNWVFTNPFADMKDFCCDQDVVYDRGRDLFLWYRQGVGDSSGKNRFTIGASIDGGATWCTYSVAPSNLDQNWTKDQAFDYPELALSNNNLYIHTGLKGTGVPSTALIRLPLDPLASCGNIPFFWWGQVSYWGGLVQGATTTMYIGDHQASANSFRIYSQPENITGILWTEVAIPAWQLEEGEPVGACPAADLQNWCARSDSVVRGGWVANGVVGFLWHARAGKGFPFPYIEAATFNQEKNFAYLGRPNIWSKNGAWHYPFVSPNGRGDIAVTAYFSTAASFPSPEFLIFDDYSPHPPPAWEAYSLSNSTGGAPAWGDYVRNRAFQPSGVGWVTSASIVQDKGVTPLFFILGRERDVPSITRFWNK
jgi:hypothetical protein